MNKEQAASLRKAFAANQIGTLPKGGVRLEYVGHAATTDRLLQVDPDWTWAPVAHDERGLPRLDEHGGLWISADRVRRDAPWVWRRGRQEGAELGEGSDRRRDPKRRDAVRCRSRPVGERGFAGRGACGEEESPLGAESSGGGATAGTHTRLRPSERGL
jgi:hypothetical protein